VSDTTAPATASPDDTILLERKGGELWITLNRPDAANALTPDQRNRLIEVFEGASADSATRVVVLAANGRHFCSGADLSGGTGGPPAVGDVARMLRTGSQRLIASVLDCEKPVVAELHGAAAGIGSHLVLSCDFVVAADDGRLIEVFARRGLVPDGGGAYLLPRLVGPMRAKELMMLADDLPAERARELGLVTAVVKSDELRGAVEELAARLASAPTRSLALSKWLVNRSLESSRDQCFADEAVAQEQNMGTRDAQEGVAAFVERRTPAFEGR
jgi:2-(1,2-epoxy-1,2-dihydrophenyl)acetyl-CoA isomerase